MSADPAKPRLAFILLTYKQEKYVREAVRAALAQDYENLEVVISDDASPDGTWRIIEEEASSYRGPHRIVLNRNQSNQGLIGNLYAAVRSTAAEYLVMAAGDDISEPARASAIAMEFTNDPTVKLVSSDVLVIDETGASIGRSKSWRSELPISCTSMLQAETCYVLGCANAYSREVFDRFPQIPLDVAISEDQVLPFRAVLIGNAAYIDKPLVRYRQHPVSISQSWRSASDHTSGQRAARYRVSGFEQMLGDIEHFRSQSGAPSHDFSDLHRKCASVLDYMLWCTRWETRGSGGFMALVWGVAARRIGWRDAIKVLLRVNFTRSWTWYVRQRMKTR